MWSYRITCVFLILFLTSISSAATNKAPKLESNVLPANGRQETILNIYEFGRFSIIAKSEQGTAVQYIDRMSGPSLINGTAGRTNGRLDVFLDRGTYKIITYSHAEGDGEVALTVNAFNELHKGPAPQLIENKLIETHLEDFQQRSFWLNIKQRRTVMIESAGRNLGDLRLWRDGNWLIDKLPSTTVVEPHEGQPVSVHRIVVDLQPGLYLLTHYGGPQQDWAETAAQHPLYIRMGIPKLAEAGRARMVTSPFGFDRWLIPAESSYFRLELNKAEPATISVSQFDQNNPFVSYGNQQSITKKSRVPVAELNQYSSTGLKLVTVNYTAGKPYIMQHFKAAKSVRLNYSGRYWVSTLHSGFGSDSVDATAILTEYSYNNRVKLVDHRAIALDEDKGWKRRFNLLSTLTLHFEIKEKGRYRVSGKGVDATFRFEPFLTSRPRDYRAPGYKTLGSSWDLDAGFYVLTVKNDREGKGIVTLAVNSVKQGDMNKNNAAQTAIRFPEVNVTHRRGYTVYLNEQPGVQTGLLVRSLPIDLSSSLPITLMAQEKITVPVRIPVTGELTVVSEEGALLDISVNKGPAKKRHNLSSGFYSVSIQNEAKKDLHSQLSFTEEKYLAQVPLPPVSKDALDKIPNFPALTAARARFFNVDKDEEKTFRVSVKTPNLYRVETTGLLQTQGNIRTRTQISLDRQSNNGVGRNFLIQQYLREGEYQLTVKPEGETRGHLGLQLVQTKLQHDGVLLEDIPARYTLKSGQGLIYEFTINKKGRYKLDCFGLSGKFPVRLEDGEGWPILRPGIAGNINQIFYPGKYRLVVLPMTLTSKLTALLKAETKVVKRQGPGPFDLPRNQSVSHTWIESELKGVRIPDRWRFDIPATVNATISLSQDMQGVLYRVEEKTQIEKSVGRISHANPFAQELTKGKYLVRVENRRKNNRFDYVITLRVNEMTKGETRVVQAPVDIPISIGTPGLFEMGSLGLGDVKAALYDEDKRLIVANDDRPHSWDFNVAQTLFPGKYTLRVTPVGNAYTQTQVMLRSLRNKMENKRVLPSTFSINDTFVHNYPLQFKQGKGVLAIAASSRDTVGLAVEKKINQRWVSIGTFSGSNPLLTIAIEDQKVRYRLKVWAPEQRKATIKVTAEVMKARVIREKDLAAGLQLKSKNLLTHTLAVALVELDRPGVFKQKSGQGLFWSAVADTRLSKSSREIVSGDSKRIWLVMDAKDSQIEASRIRLSAQKQPLVIPPESVMWLDSKNSNATMELVLAESRTGQPGILFDDKRSPLSMGVDHYSAIAIKPSKKSSAIKVWNADPGSVELPVQISRWGFKKLKQKTIRAGIHYYRLTKSSANRYKLPKGNKQLRFSLPKSVAATLVKNDRFMQSFWSAHADKSVLVSSDADAILFFNTAKTSKPVSLTVVTQADGDVQTVSEKMMLKRYFPEAGVFSFTVESNKAGHAAALNFYGKDISVVSVDKLGQVKRGYPVSIKDKTILSVHHGSGLMVAWLNEKQAGDLVSNEKTINLPTSIKLSGQSKTVKFDNAKPTMVHLSTMQPIITRFQTPGLQERVQIFEKGMNLNMLIPKGPSVIVFENVSMYDLNGKLELHATDIMDLSEGLGPAVSLSPGGARTYRFKLTKKQQVGLGVKASIDVANCILFNERGEKIGFGVSQMHTLDKGVYYLMVQLPETGPTVQVQPALVGLDAPGTGPSQQIMQTYQKLISPKTL